MRRANTSREGATQTDTSRIEVLERSEMSCEEYTYELTSVRTSDDTMRHPHPFVSTGTSRTGTGQSTENTSLGCHKSPLFRSERRPESVKRPITVDSVVLVTETLSQDVFTRV